MLINDQVAQWAKDGAKLGDCGRMCNDCAFKKGTKANSDIQTIENFIYWFDLSNPEAKFYCHHDLPDGVLIDKSKICAGFLYVQQHFKQTQKSHKMRPIDLKAGNVFRIRKAPNARKFTVQGLVLKISKENNFDTSKMHPDLIGKMMVPIESPYNFGQLILDPDDEIYLVR